MNISLLEKRWYALCTKPRCEFKAALHIEKNSIEYYLPSVTKLKQWSDRKKKITEPLIRGYVFIFADERERMIALEHVSIVKCLFNHGRPSQIPAWQIENLKLMLKVKAEFFVKEGLLPGVKVRIKEGPFEGVEGIIHHINNEQNIAVSLDFINRSIITHLPKDCGFEIIKN